MRFLAPLLARTAMISVVMEKTHVDNCASDQGAYEVFQFRNSLMFSGAMKGLIINKLSPGVTRSLVTTSG